MAVRAGKFRGTEPLVGEIVGLRTFRVDDSGLLLPLYSTQAWYDGTNAASCAPPTGDRNRRVHAVPDEECECGFYAYGNLDAAAGNRQLHYVQAVVSCWGAVLAGTQGVRAQYARIEALWLHPNAPGWLRSRVAARYPSARLYADAAAMHAEHPTTSLPCYQPTVAPSSARRIGAGLALAAILALGLLPLNWLRAVPVLQDGWLAAVACAALLTGWLALAARSLGHLAAAVVVGGVLAWLLAPLLGLPGWLLRIPLLRALGASVLRYVVRLRPHYFPVVKSPQPKAFCGVRP
jgi:hypothetical protein